LLGIAAGPRIDAACSSCEEPSQSIIGLMIKAKTLQISHLLMSLMSK
jgi:hypothetical protein